MFVIRIAGALTALIVVGCLGLYLVTSDRRYLNWAWRTGQFALYALVVWLVLFLIERLVLVV